MTIVHRSLNRRAVALAALFGLSGAGSCGGSERPPRFEENEACACEVYDACCLTWSAYCATIASSYRCVVNDPQTLDDAELTWRSLHDWKHAPGEASDDGLFPERSRARPLADLPFADPDLPANAFYDFESCQLLPQSLGPDSLRVRGGSGGLPEEWLALEVPGLPPCESDEDCFLRMNTLNLGATVTLTEQGVPCDDPAAAGAGSCAIGLSSPTVGGVNDGGGYRGNVIIADRIFVSGRIVLGYLALVLIAREYIEFMPGSAIIGPAAVPPPAVAEIGAAFSEELAQRSECVGVVRTQDPENPVEEVIERVTPRRFTQLLGADAGVEPREATGRVALIAPIIVGQGTIDLTGRTGGDGGPGVDVLCEYWDLDCQQSIADIIAYPDQGADGGHGGRGGPGGKLTVRSRWALPDAIAITVAGGQGGDGGRGGALTITSQDRCPGTYPRHFWFPDRVNVIGFDGVRGGRGAGGEIDLGGLTGEEWIDYAWVLARRGADRHLRNGRYYAKNVVDPTSVQRAHRSFDVVERHYCGRAAMRIDRSIDPLGLIDLFIPTPGAAPHPLHVAEYGPDWAVPSQGEDRLIDVEAAAGRSDACAEARVHQARVADRVNTFGFPADYRTYLRPDILAGFRATVVARFAERRDTFWRSVALQASSFDAEALHRQAEAIAAEHIRAREVAEARREQLVQKLIVALQRVERDENAVADLQARLDVLATELAPMLENTCDVFCVFAQWFQVIVGIVASAISVVGLVGALGDFIAQVETTEVWDQPVPPDSFGDKGVAYAIGLAKMLREAGAEERDRVADRVTGFGEAIALFADRAAAVEAAPGRPEDNDYDRLRKTLASLIASLARNEAGLLDSLGQINSALGRVENGTLSVRDQAGAAGHLRQMRDLVLLQLERNRSAVFAMEEHMLAALELAIAEEEQTAALLAEKDAVAQAQTLGCRVGRVPAADCGDIVALPSTASLRALRDDLCRQARDLNDTVLLFDYLYGRSREFVLLADLAPGDPAAAASLDLRRNLLIPAEWTAFLGLDQTYTIQDLVTELNGATDGMHAAAFCVPDAPSPCPFAVGADAAENARVMSDLLRDGRATFAVGEPVPEMPRQRVIDFDLRFHTAAPYRLGCADATTCPAPAAGLPPDTPFSHVWRFEFAHDELATFEWDDGSLRSFSFSPSTPIVACEAAQALLPVGATRRDCSRMVSFRGDGGYESAIAQQLANQVAIDVGRFGDPDLFGTSVRGRWTIDMRGVIEDLGADDGCYGFANAPMLDACLPDDCPPGACERDPATQETAYEPACRPYLHRAQLRAYGDLRCCTTSGRAVVTPANPAACAGLGLTSDETCRTPDMCFEICGPACKAMKAAVRGVQYRIYWRAER